MSYWPRLAKRTKIKIRMVESTHCYHANFNFRPLRYGTEVILIVNLLVFLYRTIRGQCRWRSASRGSLSERKLRFVRLPSKDWDVWEETLWYCHGEC